MWGKPKKKEEKGDPFSLRPEVNSPEWKKEVLKMLKGMRQIGFFLSVGKDDEGDELYVLSPHGLDAILRILKADANVKTIVAEEIYGIKEGPQQQKPDDLRGYG